jgi:hypothetical protein
LIGISFATAQGVWNEAQGTPPAKNVSTPLNEGSNDQEKTGQLVTSGIINSSGDFITYANLYVGGNGYKTPAYLFGDTYFKKMTRSGATENRLCLNPEGQVKACNDVSFKAVEPVFYTNTNLTKFPSGGVNGYVSYKIGQNEYCTTSSLSNTDWGGKTLVGVENRVAVNFSDWGTYNLKITCAGIEYTTTIKIGGKITPSTTGTNINYNLDLATSRSAQIILIGGGASGSNGSEDHCITGYDGGSTFVKIGSTTIANVGGGGKSVAGTVSGCKPVSGSGGRVASGTQLSNVYSNDGYEGNKELGGCSGAPDANNDLNTCNNSGNVLPYGKAGAGADGVNGRGGGGGAYIKGSYTLPASGTLTVFVGSAGGNGGRTPQGQNGYISIEW